MIKILKAYGIWPRILQAIEATYTNTTARVVTLDSETEVFELMAGVLQGDTLAPFIFIIVLDYALRQAIGNHEDLGFTITPRRSMRVGSVTLTDLDFADDIALLWDDITGARSLLLRVETEGNKVDLHLNAKKTEYVTYNIADHEILKTIEGAPLKQVCDFKYLVHSLGAQKRTSRCVKVLPAKPSTI